MSALLIAIRAVVVVVVKVRTFETRVVVFALEMGRFDEVALTEEQLSTLEQAQEVHVVTQTPRGHQKTIIWIVVVDGTVYVRSVVGERGRWYQRALANPSVAIETDTGMIPFRAVHVDDDGEIEAVTAALHAKYPPGGSLNRMVRDEVLGTTLRLEPVTPQS